ncbi:MAG TPA: UvrD-helicase domain-containing protein [Candidatus Coproplasma excrementipullorum]|nr:UvrD-helicase domain-containing protein [Candidatus Coproplasma excrementipullorum]
MDNLLSSLNSEQIKPVTDTEGPVLVLAGAGSGKTRVLTSRIAYILEKGLCSPQGILAITFTNKAAGEMRERLEGMLGDTSGMWICTIHSMCVRILRQFAAEAGIKSNFSIYSETERANIIKKSFKELDFDDEKLLKDAKYHIGNAKMLGLDPDTYGTRFKDIPRMDDIVCIYDKYDKHLASNNALDFDDLLIRTLRLLRGNEEARDFLSDKFRYILVDEFQDTNAVQYNIVKLLASKHRNLFAVGDDDQSIYGWRGAEIENILRFDKDYPDAKIYKLERNYRSTKSILNLANAIIKNNGARHKKTLWTEAEEGEKPVCFQAEEEADEALFAARTISSAVAHGEKYSSFAVLMRINALTRSYEQEFTKYGIPYKVFGGFRFFERREIKDILAYLRLISNPFDDEALTRIINVPKRGIGGKTIEAMEAYATQSGLSLYDACLDGEYLPLTAGAKSKIQDFANTIKDFVIDAQSVNVAQLVRDIISRTELRLAYDDGSDEGDSKLANLDEYIASVDDFVRLNPDATLDEYLNQVTLASDTDDMDDGNYVTLATIHSVKGLEFDNVIICGLEDGIMPSSRSENDPKSLEEERRLMYVAITRARKKLYLTRSKSRYLYGRRDRTMPSRFIGELADELGVSQSSLNSSYSYGGSAFGGTYSRGGYGGYSNARSYGSNYGSGYGSGYGSSRSSDYGESSRGRGVYSSDEGYVSDLPPAQPKRTERANFSAASTFGRAQQGKAKSYSVGTKVKHPKFGNGTVIAVKNGGTVINIAFEGQGIKELSAALAPLEIVQ